MDSIQAQLQIRQNALEAQDYAKELLDWQQTLKAKASSRQQQAEHRTELPVRGRAHGAIQPAPEDDKQPALLPKAAGQQQPSPAAHTYKNYSKWDKFDVDAALQEADTAASHAQPTPSQLPSASVRRSVSQQQQQQQQPMIDPRQPNAPVSSRPQTPAAQATALKDQGNKLFQAKYYKEAISCYSQSLEAYPTAVAYANRAMAYLKLDKYQQAEADCTAAIALDPAYVKAWHRRGTARRQLGQLLEAAADFEAVLRLEPGNAPVQADRNQTLDQHLKQQQIQRSNVWHDIPVKLQEVQQQKPAQQLQQDRLQHQKQQAPVSGASGSSAAAAADAVIKPAVSPSSVRPVTPPISSGSKGSSPQLSPQQRGSVAAAAQAAAQQLADRLASSLKAPKSGHEFESAWRSLKGDVQLQGKYLRLLQPQQLPGLFKSSLTAPLVNALLTAILASVVAPAADDSAATSQQLQPQQAVCLIEGLVAVPRFDMMAMSLSSRDKAALRQQWDTAAAAVDGALQQRLAAVRPKYRL